jgi:hypothetical protein
MLAAAWQCALCWGAVQQQLHVVVFVHAAAGATCLQATDDS